jgi:predicted alpha/beta-fold hydrolase
MKKKEEFEPFPLIENSLAQTVIGSYFNFQVVHGSITEFVQLPDRDLIAMEVATPKGWKEEDLTVVFLHGLCGSHKSAYLIRMTKRVLKQGYRSIRVNMRGCGSGRGHAKKFYHCGSSDDIFHVISHIKNKHPNSPIILIGFSLGGHIVLKMTGELGERAKQYVEQVYAVSPPIKLVSSMRLMCHPNNRLFANYFVKLLIDNVKFLQKRFPEIEQFQFPENMTLLDFDEMFVAPRVGYSSAFEYYRHCSSLHLIPKITVPCKILFAIDDPIIDPHDIEEIELPSNVEIFKTDRGGHLGFLGMPGKTYGFRWMDSLLMSWIKQFSHGFKAKNV